MPDEQPTSPDAVAGGTPAEDALAEGALGQTPETLVYEPVEEDGEWIEEPEELPRRPRRRLLTPLPLVLIGVLLIACGFIAGVLVEKGEGSSSSGSAASVASRFAALRGGTSGAAATRTGAAGAGASSGAAAASGGGFSRPTSGQVAFLSGSTLYVTNAEGNTVKVTSSPGTSVTKTVKTDFKSIHPGETVSVIGEKGSNGAVSAESISVGSSGGGLAALFSGAGAGGGGTRASGSGAGGGGSGSTPSLFGSG